MEGLRHMKVDLGLPFQLTGLKRSVSVINIFTKHEVLVVLVLRLYLLIHELPHHVKFADFRSLT